MPVKSEAQRRLMYAALRDPKGVGIPRSVAEKFVGPKAHKADGGAVKESEMESKKMAKKEVAFMQKKGAPKSMIKHEKAEYGLKKGGKACYAKGGGIEQRGKTGGQFV